MEQLLDIDFNVSAKHKICEDIIFATSACGKFLHENTKFFSYPHFGSLKGELLSYAVARELYNSAFTPKATYRTEPKEMNNYNRKVLHLYTDNFITTVAKTVKPNSLPNKSNYKKRYAIANSYCDGQINMSLLGDELLPSPPKYYSIITYGYNSIINECSHINLIVPDSDFKKNLVTQDLKESYVHFTLVEPTIHKEEEVAKLHEELENFVKLKTVNK
jgi:hypothetical protein